MGAVTATTAHLERRPGALRVVRGIVLRPLTVAVWRETAYLLLGAVTAAAAFAVILSGTIVGGLLAITVLGLPILLLVVFVMRVLARLDRRRAALVLDGRIEARYRSRGAEGLYRNALLVLKDPATWKDFLWLVLLTPLGFAFGVAAASLWAVVGYALTMPTYWWALPASAYPDFGPDWTVDSWARVALVAAGSIPLAVAVAWVVRALALAEALLARLLLSPGRSVELEERVEELTETRSAAVDAQDAELRRIERDLHDGAQARLVALAMDLGLAQEKLETDPAGAEKLVASAHDEAKTALRELRDLVRGIHPAVLADRGLDAALSALAARSPVPVMLEIGPVGRLPATLEAAAYFFVSEGLANVARHSDATRSTVRVARRDDLLVVEIEDDGVGGADPGRGSGIAGLEGRVRALDGMVAVASPAGGGTILHAEIPCAS
jgi:signal transduction histidine kinase